MVSSARRAKSKVRARRNVARGLMANVNARRAEQNARRAEQNREPPQPPNDAEREANQVVQSPNQVVQPPNAIPERELNPLPHGQMVQARIVRSDGIDSAWDPKLIRFYECWWNVSFHHNLSDLFNFKFRQPI